MPSQDLLSGHDAFLPDKCAVKQFKIKTKNLHFKFLHVLYTIRKARSFFFSSDKKSS